MLVVWKDQLVRPLGYLNGLSTELKQENDEWEAAQGF